MGRPPRPGSSSTPRDPGLPFLRVVGVDATGPGRFRRDMGRSASRAAARFCPAASPFARLPPPRRLRPIFLWRYAPQRAVAGGPPLENISDLNQPSMNVVDALPIDGRQVPVDPEGAMHAAAMRTAARGPHAVPDAAAALTAEEAERVRAMVEASGRVLMRWSRALEAAWGA